MVPVPTVKDALNKLKWHHDRLEEAVVWYTHRGAPGDVRAVEGDKVLDLGSSFFHVQAPEGETAIPYHRVQRIEIDGRPFWERHPRHRTLGDLEKARQEEEQL